LDHWKSIIAECGTVHCDLVDPAALYGSAALALVRCGFVSYELALLGISTVNIYSTSVQTEVARSLEFHGVGVALSELNLNNDSALYNALKRGVALNLLGLNGSLVYGATAVAELLEKIHE
jgi:spore coat polysaccharide biosynthesis predicted glycosyltransferase SpsG